MFPFDEKLRRVWTLTAKEMEVVFWQIRGKSDPEIANLINVAEKTVPDRRTGVYRKLGLKDLNDNEKPKALIREYSLAVSEVVPDETALKNYTPAPVSASATERGSTPTTDPTNDGGRPRRNRTLLWVSLGFLGLLVAFGYTAYYFYNLGANNLPVSTISPTPQNIPISSPDPTQEPPTLTSAAPLPADTPLPPTATYTATIEPTITPTKEFYNQGEYAPITEGITMTLLKNFAAPSRGDYWEDKPSFAIQLDVISEGGAQFVARFDPSTFSAKDDAGNDYPLVEVVRNGGMAPHLVGPQSIVSYGENLFVRFHGNFPPEAQYLIITVGSFNGKTLVFHKQI